MVTGKFSETLPQMESEPEVTGIDSENGESNSTSNSTNGRLGRIGTKFRNKLSKGSPGEGEQAKEAESGNSSEPAPEVAVPVRKSRHSKLGKLLLRGFRETTPSDEPESDPERDGHAATVDKSPSAFGKFLRNIGVTSETPETTEQVTSEIDDENSTSSSPPPIPPKPVLSPRMKNKLFLKSPSTRNDSDAEQQVRYGSDERGPPTPPEMPQSMQTHGSELNASGSSNNLLIPEQEEEHEEDSAAPLIKVDSRGRVVPRSTSSRSSRKGSPSGSSLKDHATSSSASIKSRNSQTGSMGKKGRRSERKGKRIVTAFEVDDSPPLMVWQKKKTPEFESSQGGGNSYLREQKGRPHDNTSESYVVQREGSRNKMEETDTVRSLRRSYESDDSERRRRRHHMSKKKSLRRTTSSQQSSLMGSSKNLTPYSTSTLKRASRLKLLGKPEASTWEVPRVAAWLDMLGLSQYTKQFEENGVNGQVLLMLDREQIVRGFGITEHYHLMSLERGIQELRKRHIEYDSWEWTADGVQLWLLKRGFDLLCHKFYTAAIHGGVLFNLTREELSQLVCEAHNPDGNVCPAGGHQHHHELIVESLILCIERAKTHGRDSDNGIPDWGGPEIHNWLTENHLAHLYDKFSSHCMSGMLLLRLTREDMEDIMGLTEIQAMVLEKAIIKLKQQHLRSQGIVGKIASVITRGANKNPVRERFVERLDADDTYYSEDEFDDDENYR